MTTPPINDLINRAEIRKIITEQSAILKTLNTDGYHWQIVYRCIEALNAVLNAGDHAYVALNRLDEIKK